MTRFFSDLCLTEGSDGRLEPFAEEVPGTGGQRAGGGMTATTERPRKQPDPEPEREVDFSRYLDALVARWWLPVAGLIVGAAIGYFLALGGKDVYRAQATVYVGTPLGPNGTLLQHARDEPEHRRPDRPRAGDAPAGRSVLGHVRPRAPRRSLDPSDQERRPEDGAEPALCGHGRGAQARRGERSANAIAERIVAVTGGYARLKVDTFKQQIASDQRQLDAIDQQSTQVRAQLDGASSDRAPDPRQRCS